MPASVITVKATKWWLFWVHHTSMYESVFYFLSLTHSFDHLYQCRVMNSYFIPRIIICCCHYVLQFSAPYLVTGSPFKLAPVSCHISLSFSHDILFYWCHKMSHAHLAPSLPQLWKQTILQGALCPFKRIWYLDTKFSVLMVSRPSKWIMWTELGKNTHVCRHLTLPLKAMNI